MAKTTPAVPASSSSPAASTAVAGGGVPGLPAEAATHMEVVSAARRTLDGMPAYYLTLSIGHAWAIKGATVDVVPKVMKGREYTQTASFFLRSGPYVVFFPSLDAPEAFMGYLGPRPGMKVIDTDTDLSSQ